MPKPRSRDHIHSPEEIAKLRSCCQNQEELLLVDIPIEAGLRIGELAHLRRSWLDKDGAISIPDRQSCNCGECTRLKAGYWAPKTKAGIRSIPLKPALARELKEYLASHPEGFGLSRVALWTKLKTIAKRAQVASVFPHSLRATCATRLAEEGISAATLQYLMGWSSLNSADAYIRSSKRRAQEELAKIWNK